LEGFKAKLDAEKKAEEERQKTAAPKGKPLPPPRPAPAPAARRPEPATTTSDRDDDMSFHRMMSGVTPLDAGAKSRVPVTTDVRPGAQRLKAAEVKARASAEAEQALAHLHS
ncbi:hypothetical protein, partial [Escherichia coli]|uniref:hypothetical protein n=1 Tax=Escherichia coli TaxID=562 RepID=UPI0017B2D204